MKRLMLEILFACVCGFVVFVWAACWIIIFLDRKNPVFEKA